MKIPSYLRLLLIISSLCLCLAGCAIKPAPVPTRHFTLSPLPPTEDAIPAAQPLVVEVGFVKMPSYLLRDSVVVRKNADEVEYLETALWAERLDQSFRQTLAENLSLLLASNPAPVSSSEVDPTVLRVSVNVQQFDVNTEGQGTLLAVWRITPAHTDKPVKIGQAQLTRTGPSPRANPQAIAATLSALLAEFSRDLTKAVQP